MHGRTLKLFRILFMTALLVSGMVQQGFCDGDSRPATQDEKQFHQTVINTLSQALPPCPEGWEQTNDTTTIEELGRVSPGAEEYPLQVDYCFSCQNTQKIMEAQMQMMEEMEKMVKNNTVISEEMVHALDEKMSPHDVKTTIRIEANLTSLGVYENSFEAVESIAGGRSFRSAGEFNTSRGWREGTTFVFLGKNWKMNDSAGKYMETTADPGLPHTAVQTIVVRIDADPARAEQILRQIKWDALKKIMAPSAL